VIATLGPRDRALYAAPVPSPPRRRTPRRPPDSAPIARSWIPSPIRSPSVVDL
jgi:hypothetical protein